MIIVENFVEKAFRLIYGRCYDPTTTEDPESLGPHVVSALDLGVPAIAHDLSYFDTTFQVPEGLSRHVVSSMEVQANWYRELLEAWEEATSPPKTREEAARLVIQTLKGDEQADVEGLLAFYGLPHPPPPPPPPPRPTLIQVSAESPSSLPYGIQFELHTLPVDAKDVGDGDGMTVYVSTADPQESKSIPREVLLAVDQRLEVRGRKNSKRADALHRQIINSGYRFINHQNGEILARKYRIRLRGIDAPEMSMPFGNEAKDELVKLVRDRCLRVLVYEIDQYGRIIADVFCDGIFVQEVMLKKGFAWHHKAFDQRLELATWEKEAMAKQVGLWASPNPEKPWEWKKKNRREEKASILS
ncbi:hypothetical protein SLE2022_072430 [Rubroshorea leprosula]